ncbi:MAG: ATP-binding cassette domain-containing protein [Deltaproteobacteria bacterium]|nr:ATP-binding cassette domain-containing protein [Deltaproteobacteria bacterium]
MGATPHLDIRNLCMAYGESIIQQNLNFTVEHGEIFVIMGGSGCGKSTLLRHLVGLMEPTEGEVLVNGVDIWNVSLNERDKLSRRAGGPSPGGALWSSMTLAENIELLLTEYTTLNKKQIQDVIAYKLSLVGLSRYRDYYPSEISGGMRKRAGLARAMALDPEILFFDEPSAGLDPVSSRLLDDLILELRESLGATIVIVSHELASIFTVADNSIFLDPTEKTIIASGPPKLLLESSQDSRVIRFLTRTT